MPFPRNKPGCARHCFIWWYRDNVLIMGCGHCPIIYKKIVSPAGAPGLLELQASRSLAGHERICGRPVR